MVKVNILELLSSGKKFKVPFFERDYIYQEGKMNKLLEGIRISNYHYFDDLLFYEDNNNLIITYQLETNDKEIKLILEGE